MSSKIKGGLPILDNYTTAVISTTFSSKVEVRPNVNLTFINNTAEETGGAIHVTFPAIRYTADIFNRLCFIQYRDPAEREVPPHEWEVGVPFFSMLHTNSECIRSWIQIFWYQ